MSGRTEDAAREIRLGILECVKSTGRRGAHVAPCLSCADILAVLFWGGMDLDRDLFVLSKGHAGLAYYAAMAEAGLITMEQFASFDTDGGQFPGQPSRSAENRVVFSSGSLGMGLSYAAGRALCRRARGEAGRVFVLMGDGELDEGSNWEAAAYAAQMGLSNLVAIVDANGMQSDGASEDIVRLDLPAIWEAFGWETRICDGHDCADISSFLGPSQGAPVALVARTVKGKGVSFMEGNALWHHAALTDSQFEQAVAEVRDGL